MKTDSEDTEVHKQNTDSLRVQTGVKLPKFVLQKFDGDILRWKQFEESFEAAVHKNKWSFDRLFGKSSTTSCRKLPLDKRYLYFKHGNF